MHDHLDIMTTTPLVRMLLMSLVPFRRPNALDDDECALGTNDCRQLGPKWKCVNTKGSFRCEKKTCPDNQILNSWGHCTNITCTPGYKPSNKKCVGKFNECLISSIYRNFCLVRVCIKSHTLI